MLEPLSRSYRVRPSLTIHLRVGNAPTHLRVLTSPRHVETSFLCNKALVAGVSLDERRYKLALRNYLRALGPDLVQHTGHQLGPDALPGQSFRHFRMDQYDPTPGAPIFDECHRVTAGHLEAAHRRVVSDYQHVCAFLRPAGGYACSLLPLHPREGGASRASSKGASHLARKASSKSAALAFASSMSAAWMCSRSNAPR